MKKIVIGTANFGMDYGIGHNQNKLIDSDIVEIINTAKKTGIDTIDTAISYGNCEKILGKIGLKNWKVITKLPQIPLEVKKPYEWCNDQILSSLKKLNIYNLDGVLLHHPKDILKLENKDILQSLFDLKKDNIIKKIGVSIYEKRDLEDILELFCPEIIQCPLNIIDTRLLENNYLESISKLGIEIHIRSIFLQGILLNSFKELPKEFSKFQNFWIYWKTWLETNKLSPLEACIRFVNSISYVDKILVGVNSKCQLSEIIKYFEKPSINYKPSINFQKIEELIDPRFWKNNK